MHTLTEIIDIINQYKSLGYKRLDNGTYLVGKVPHIAPQAWLHEVYPPISEDKIEKITNQISFKLNSEYKSFLTKMNGINLFSCNLSLYGFRDNFIRNEDNIWQPFDIMNYPPKPRPQS